MENDHLKIVSRNTLPVMESFYTIQGEGSYQGHAAYFIRLGGCDVGCHWCDVKESWDASAHPLFSVDEIINKAKAYPGRIAVVTGGEPAMYDLNGLTLGLQNANFRTHIETSGAYLLSGKWDWVCISPKKFKAPVMENYPLANELKVIVYNMNDFRWAEEHARLVNDTCKLYLQPEWSKQEKMLPAIIEYVKDNPKWQISLQVHKYMNIP